MNIDRIQSELIRLYGGRSEAARGGGSARGPAEGRDADRTTGASASRADGFVISDEAALLQRLANVVTSSSDVRESLVADLRRQLQSGTYRTADEDVARRLLALGVAD